MLTPDLHLIHCGPIMYSYIIMSTYISYIYFFLLQSKAKLTQSNNQFCASSKYEFRSSWVTSPTELNTVSNTGFINQSLFHYSEPIVLLNEWTVELIWYHDIGSSNFFNFTRSSQVDIILSDTGMYCLVSFYRNTGTFLSGMPT